MTVTQDNFQNSGSLFDQMQELEHEQLAFCHDKETGLKAIIGIHNTVLGPAMGGTRMWNYTDEQAAIRDVLRLSRGMTFKNAIAGLNIGGGKAVIIGDAKKLKSEALMRRFGKFVESLGGIYWTAEDVNMSTRDMEHVNMETKYVTGLPISMGGSGDPSPVTAYGVYLGMKATAKKVYGTDDLSGKKIVVQGVGHVGTYLVERLVKENASVYISDIFDDKIKEVTDQYSVKVLGKDDVYGFDGDIYAPCALGATLNDQTIPDMKYKIVAGGANNQLDDELRNGRQLIEKGIVYAPDFLINSGGITNVYYEQQGNYNRDSVYAQTEQIYDVCLEVLDQAEKKNITSQEAAMNVAKKRIEDIGRIKLTF